MTNPCIKSMYLLMGIATCCTCTVLNCWLIFVQNTKGDKAQQSAWCWFCYIYQISKDNNKWCKSNAHCMVLWTLMTICLPTSFQDRWVFLQIPFAFGIQDLRWKLLSYIKDLCPCRGTECPAKLLHFQFCYISHVSSP